MLQFALVLGLFLSHALTITAVRSGNNGLRHRASVEFAWEAPSDKTLDTECTKYAGRWPKDTEWKSQAAAFKCCEDFSCGQTNKQMDCRQYPFPKGLTKAKWEDTMKAAFGGASSTVLVDALPAGAQVSPTEAGYRAVSLATLEKILEAAKELFSGGKLKVVNKRFYPKGEEKSYDMLTMHDINGLIVMPLAASSHKSFAEHVGGGKPTFFLSHNWAGRFKLFVESVQNHFAYKQTKTQALTKENAFYWVCTFANNQFSISLDGAVEKGPFATAITTALKEGKHGGDVVAIQDDQSPLKDPHGDGMLAEYYTPGRVWCAFEYFFAILHGAPIVFNTGSTNTLMDVSGTLHGKKPKACFKDRMLEFDWDSMSKKNNADAVKKIQTYMEAQKKNFENAIGKHPQLKDFAGQGDELKAFNAIMKGMVKKVESDPCHEKVTSNSNPVSDYGMSVRRMSMSHAFRRANTI